MSYKLELHRSDFLTSSCLELGLKTLSNLYSLWLPGATIVSSSGNLRQHLMCASCRTLANTRMLPRNSCSCAKVRDVTLTWLFPLQHRRKSVKINVPCCREVFAGELRVGRAHACDPTRPILACSWKRAEPDWLRPEEMRRDEQDIWQEITWHDE